MGAISSKGELNQVIELLANNHATLVNGTKNTQVCVCGQDVDVARYKRDQIFGIKIDNTTGLQT